MDCGLATRPTLSIHTTRQLKACAYDHPLLGKGAGGSGGVRIHRDTRVAGSNAIHLRMSAHVLRSVLLRGVTVVRRQLSDIHAPVAVGQEVTTPFNYITDVSFLC
jgi:hypothetical protein